MVAACINAETGVGPAIASGSQVYKGICALLPVAPINSNKVITVISVLPSLDTLANTSLYATVPNRLINQKIAIRKARSPIRFMINALLAALLYSVFLNQ